MQDAPPQSQDAPSQFISLALDGRGTFAMLRQMRVGSLMCRSISLALDGRGTFAMLRQMRVGSLMCRSISLALDGRGTFAMLHQMRVGSLGSNVAGASS